VRAAITVSDAEGYTRRDDDGQRDLQTWMTNIENQAALNAGLDRRRAYVQGTGDGSHTTWPPETSELDLLTNYLRELRCELDRVNGALAEHSKIRMRFSVCAGLVEVGPQGVTGQSAIRAALLVNNDRLRSALRQAPGQSLAVIIEDKLYQDVVLTRRRGLRPENYERVVITDKYGNDHAAWVTIPGGPMPGMVNPAEFDPLSGPQPRVARHREPMMSDSISVAADALVTFLAAGGGAVAAGAAQEAGAEATKALTSVAAKLGKRLRGQAVDKDTVTTALREAVDAGEVTMAEVEQVRAARVGFSGSASYYIGTIDVEGISVVGNGTTNIDTVNIGKGDT
jgi:hypothetical protein